MRFLHSQCNGASVRCRGVLPRRLQRERGREAQADGRGQRLATAAVHVGGVIVVSGAERVRGVLVPVYRALGIGQGAS